MQAELCYAWLHKEVNENNVKYKFEIDLKNLKVLARIHCKLLFWSGLW